MHQIRFDGPVIIERLVMYQADRITVGSNEDAPGKAAGVHRETGGKASAGEGEETMEHVVKSSNEDGYTADGLVQCAMRLKTLGAVIARLGAGEETDGLCAELEQLGMMVSENADPLLNFAIDACHRSAAAARKAEAAEG